MGMNGAGAVRRSAAQRLADASSINDGPRRHACVPFVAEGRTRSQPRARSSTSPVHHYTSYVVLEYFHDNMHGVLLAFAIDSAGAVIMISRSNQLPSARHQVCFCSPDWVLYMIKPSLIVPRIQKSGTESYLPWRLVRPCNGRRWQDFEVQKWQEWFGVTGLGCWWKQTVLQRKFDMTAMLAVKVRRI